MSDVNGRKAARGGRDGRVLEFGAAAGFPIVVEIAVNEGPISGIVASPDGRRLLVTNYGRNSISVIDTATCRVVETVADVNEPFAIAMGSADADCAYVSTVSPAFDSIKVIDVPTNTVVATHPVALSVSDLAVSPDGDRLFVGTNGPVGGRLVVIGTHAEPNEARAGRSRWRRKSPTRSKGNAEQTGLRVIDTIEIGLPIRDVAVSLNGAIAYVASCAPESGAVIDVIDTRTNKISGTRKIGEIGGILTSLALGGDGDRAYLVSDDSIAVLCTLTHDVVGTVGVADQPSCVVESPDAKYLYIADYSGAVTVAPVASIVTLGIENAAHETQTPADWVMPELPQYEPALA